MKVCVDLDGTLTEDTKHYTEEHFKNVAARKEVISLVNSLYDKGDHIIIWTGRDEIHRKITEDWLNRHGVKYHKLVLGKLRFDVYIDEERKLVSVPNCEKK